MGRMREPVTASERVAIWFKLKGWSFGEAARRTGLHKQKLWRIAKGKQEPKPSEIEVIVETLGISTPEFFGGAPDADKAGPK